MLGELDRARVIRLRRAMLDVLPGVKCQRMTARVDCIPLPKYARSSPLSINGTAPIPSTVSRSILWDGVLTLGSDCSALDECCQR